MPLNRVLTPDPPTHGMRGDGGRPASGVATRCSQGRSSGTDDPSSKTSLLSAAGPQAPPPPPLSSTPTAMTLRPAFSEPARMR